MKTALRWSATLLAAFFWMGCASSTPKGAEDASDASGESKGKKGKCSEVDPFCGESGGSDDSAGSDGDSGASAGSDSTDEGSGSNASLPSAAPAGATDPMAPFKTVIVTQKPADGAKAKPGKAGTGNKVVLHPRGMAWGVSGEQVAKLYDRLLDAAYLELYKKTPVGPQQDALDAEVKDKKALMRRNRIEFGNLPTGVDNTALKGEYSYMNDESMIRVDFEHGVVRSFFFFGDRLWKTYDEHKLGKGSPLGSDWESALAYLQTQLGAEPKTLDAGEDGRIYDEAVWSDGSTLVRAVNREGAGLLGLVFVDESVQSKLPSLRKNKPKDPTAVDSTVQSVTRPQGPPPGADKDKDKKKKK
jgi:hypothetical protein